MSPDNLINGLATACCILGILSVFLLLFLIATLVENANLATENRWLKHLLEKQENQEEK